MAKRNLFEELKQALEEVQDIKSVKLTLKTATIKSKKRKVGKKD